MTEDSQYKSREEGAGSLSHSARFHSHFLNSLIHFSTYKIPSFDLVSFQSRLLDQICAQLFGLLSKTLTSGALIFKDA